MSKKGEKSFYPDYLIEILFVVFIVIESTIILALLYPPVIGRQIDFTAGFQPKPEWYFLWLYQLLRYFNGRAAFIGTIIMPVLFVTIVSLIPYLDRGRGGRTIATITGIMLLLLFLILTLIPAFFNV